MLLNGILSKIMDNYLCLRGIARIKSLAKISEVNPDIQRNLLEEHKDEMKDFLEKGEYAFFPEVVLSMELGLSGECEDYISFAEAVDSANKGFNTKVGNVRINFRPDDNKLIDDRRQLKVAQISFEENETHLSRIDGNHRLGAAASLSNDTLIPFCLIIFPNKEESCDHSRAIFHNINSKQIPIKMEQNIKIIIESSSIYTDEILEKPQPFGLHYKFTRELLCGDNRIDFSCFPNIQKLVSENKYSFFTGLFRYLLKANLISEETAVDEVKKELVSIENAIRESCIVTSTNNGSIVGALAYYKLSSPDKYHRFIKWVANNHICEAQYIGIDDIISIYDKVYDSVPKKVFLARWYPATTDENYEKAQHRLSAIKRVIAGLHLELVDLGTQEGGTFLIRSVMYNEIKECDIFIADLTGCRHNVMVEVGYAIKHVGTGRMLFYYAPTDEYAEPPFDLNGFRCERINDSADISIKVKPMIETIINGIN